MSNEYLDISFTVKDSELKGRKLVRDIRTGETRWLGGFVEVPPEVIVEVVVPEKPATKKLRKVKHDT